jgi:hypothetical protein
MVICGTLSQLHKILIFSGYLAAESFWQNPRWPPFKIEKNAQHPIFE